MAQCMHEGRLQACAEQSVRSEENEGPKIQCLKSYDVNYVDYEQSAYKHFCNLVMFLQHQHAVLAGRQSGFVS